jgi:hypothetical protein
MHEHKHEHEHGYGYGIGGCSDPGTCPFIPPPKVKIPLDTRRGKYGVENDEVAEAITLAWYSMVADD